MAYNYKDKVAIVTGGGSGLGAALAKELVARGARVVIGDINIENGKRVADLIGANVEALQLDVRDSKQIEEFVEGVKSRYGALDLMFNNAGTTNYGEISQLPLAEWKRVFDVNTLGLVSGSLVAYALMLKQKSGHIINIGSMAVFINDPLFGPYVTSKAAVVAFSRVLASEAEGTGVGVTLVCPGNIRTPLLDQREPSRFNPPVSPDLAARKILTAVEKNRTIVVFPFYAKVMWWLDRLSPTLLNPLRREILRRARLRQTV